MPQKLVQSQTLGQVQTLTPQQVLQVRLLEMPVSELKERVQNELIDNGALEESLDEPTASEMTDTMGLAEQENEPNNGDEVPTGDMPTDEYRSEELRTAMDDYASPDDIPDYLLRYQDNGTRPETVEYGDTTSFYEQMTQQMGECELTDHEQQLMEYLIGSLDDDGLLKKRLSSLADELEIYHGIVTSEEELEQVLHKLQQFDPPGIGARDLRECLMLQLQRHEHYSTSVLKQQAYMVLDKMYEDFIHKRWDRIAQRLHLSESEAARVRAELMKLTPRPGSAMGEVVGHNFQQVVPDFVVDTDAEGHVTFALNRGEVPYLRVSSSFLELLDQADTNKGKMSRSERAALQYTRQKIDSARGFIEAVRQRRQTLSAVMKAIIELQHPFFVEGDENLLKPMILKDVAERTGLDISTVSRAANSKYVETVYGTYPLKWFFSDGFVTGEGTEIATRRIQSALRELVEAEDKKNPLSDEVLAEMLNKKGYPIARRTVAKYREALGIPVARLRR